ncbi:MAG TPA: hypothetical protein VG272_03285 [Candidatus Acidoferrales bacterium]|jgi:hypothetical protein|nr:hypothetical protein [Candidatus Acidoferrales bacterium]
MEKSTNHLPCDGCGLPVTPEHIAERVHRLEQSTQFRPIHMGILFVALAPPSHTADDFYAPARSREFSDLFLEALEIFPAEKPALEEDVRANDLARLAEFQRRGHYLTYLSECPLLDDKETAEQIIQRLGPILLRRIKFNYRPRQIAPLGQELFPLIDLLNGQGIGPVLTTADGQALPLPGTGSQEWMQLFRRSVTAGAT